MTWTSLAVVAPIVVALLADPAAGQTAAAGQPPNGSLEQAAGEAARTAQTSDPPATLVYANRPIVEFRATVFMRTPAERAIVATRLIDRAVDEMPTARVTTLALDQGVVVNLAGRALFAVLTADIDPLSGENLEQTGATAAARLQLAFDEAVELRTPARLLTAGLAAAGATAVYMTLIWLLLRIRRVEADHLRDTTQRQLEKLPGGELVAHASRGAQFVRGAFNVFWLGVGALMMYAWLTFVLRRFPYTRPWGESLRSAMTSAALAVGRSIVDALPDLFIILIIVAITRFLTRLVSVIFDAVERESVTIPWLYPETAQPTRRMVVALLWVFALVVSYEYLPGSGSDAFRGVSVLVGLMVSLGSSGLVNQIMSGLTMTYSRALRKDDFVKIADMEGTVTHLGSLSMKIMTSRNEEITIPNAIVVSNATTNFSRHAGNEGVFVPTSVTIGYDVPWRQVHGLLLLAAERTSGIRPVPKPIVRQTELQDFYVKYTLLVCLDQPRQRIAVLDALHANIQDAFNEFGVQIMSPNYEADPSGPKVVPRDRWYAAPAAPPAEPAPEYTSSIHRDQNAIAIRS